MSKLKLLDIIRGNKGPLNENRVQTVKNLFYEPSHSAVDQLSERDPSGNNKYLAWMAKQTLYTKRELESRYPNIEEQRLYYAGRWKDYRVIDGLVELITYFHNNTQKYQKKDLNQYSDIEELRGATEIAKTNLSRKEMKQQGGYKVYEDDNFILIHPKTHEASCKYGSTTRWCVTMRGHTGYFERYSINGPLFFLIDKRRMPAADSPKYMQQAPDYYKVAIHYQPMFAIDGRRGYRLTDLGHAAAYASRMSKEDFVDSANVGNVHIDYWNVQDRNVTDTVFKRYLGGPGRGQKQRAEAANTALNNAMEEYTKKLLGDFYDSMDDTVDNSQRINEIRQEMSDIINKRDDIESVRNSLSDMAYYMERVLGHRNVLGGEENETFNELLDRIPFDSIGEIYRKVDEMGEQYRELGRRHQDLNTELNQLERTDGKPFAFYDLQANVPQS